MLCIANVGPVPTDSIRPKVFLRMRYDFYVPNIKILKQFGWQFEELHWPKTKNEMDELIDKVQKIDPDLSFAIEKEEYEFPHHLTNGDLEYTYFKEC